MRPNKRPHPLTISVVILTNDRPLLLKKALLSIQHQTVSPIEVITVDDSSVLRKETVAVIKAYTDALPIIKRNTQHSISYGRSIGLNASSGDLVVYLDDDCAAQRNYLQKFRAHFRRDATLTAVIGRIKNALPENVYASCQYAYYDRGLRRFFPNLTKSSPLTWGRILDCEVMAIRRSKLKTFGFPDRHRLYRNDDVELGLRLVEAKERILFDPSIIAHASPRTALFPLWTAAFWNGYSDAYTQRVYHVDLKAAPHPSPFVPWFLQTLAQKTHYTPLKRFWYAILLLSFPAVTRLGKLWYVLTHHI